MLYFAIFNLAATVTQLIIYALDTYINISDTAGYIISGVAGLVAIGAFAFWRTRW